jgi:hypothetical protein
VSDTEDYTKPYHDIMQGEYEATCTYPGCGWSGKLQLDESAGLAVGDAVYTDPADERVGRCPKCKRYTLKVTVTPSLPLPEPPQGFWKIPEV